MSSIANYKEIYMYFGYSTQIQETMYMTYGTFSNSAGIIIRDATNSQYAKIDFNSNTSITVSGIGHTDWKFSMFGR